MSPHVKPSKVPPCCMESLARRAIREHFRPYASGEVHTCDTCGARFEMHYVWQPMARVHVEPSRMTRDR